MVVATSFVGSSVQQRVRVPRATRASVRVLASSRVDKCSKDDIMVSPSILSANFAKLGEEVGIAGWDRQGGLCIWGLVNSRTLRNGAAGWFP